jgi:hypothetical protein
MAGPKFKKEEVGSEKELHQLMMEDINALEEGIKILQYEFPCGDRGRADFLYVDSGNRLGIIEVKMESDEDIVFQGLRYYDWVSKNKYAVKAIFPQENINVEEDPRLTLIAKSFSDDIKSISTHLKPDVELFEYSVLRKDDDKGLYFHPIPLPKIETKLPGPIDEKDLINYITDDKLRKVFIEKKKKIQSIDSDIKPRATKGYLGFFYKGRFVASLYPLRKSFGIQAARLDDKTHVIEYTWLQIDTGNEDDSSQIELIKDAMKKLNRCT